MPDNNSVIKDFTVQNTSKSVISRINKYRSMTRTVLRELVPWLSIAVDSGTILFTSTAKKSQIQLANFWGEIEFVSFSVEQNQSVPFLVSGTLELKILNKNLIDSTIAKRLLPPGSTLLIAFGFSDSAQPTSYDAVRKLVDIYKTLDLNDAEEYSGKFAAEFTVIAPTITVEKDNTLSVNIALYGSLTQLTKATSVSEEDVLGLSRITKEDMKILCPLSTKDLLKSIAISANSIFQLSATMGRGGLGSIGPTTYSPLTSFLYSIEYISKIDQLSTTIINNETINDQNKPNRTENTKNIDDSFIRLENVINFLCDIVPVSLGKTVKIDESNIPVMIGKKILSYKKESSEELQKRIPDETESKTSIQLFDFGHSLYEWISMNNNVDERLSDVVKYYTSCLSAGLTISTADILVPVKLTQSLQSISGLTESSFISYLTALLDSINEFYNNFIQLRLTMYGGEVCVYEYLSFNKKQAQQATATILLNFELFDDQQILLDHSLEMKLPTDYTGVVAANNITNPVLAVRAKALDYEHVLNKLFEDAFIGKLNLVKEKHSENIGLIKKVNSYIDTRNEFMSNYAEFKGLIGEADKRNGEVFKDVITDLVDSLNKNKSNLVAIYNSVLSYNDNSLVEANTVSDDLIKNNPLYPYFYGMMLSGTLTLPGIGGFRQFQRFTLHTGLSLYDYFQLPSDTKSKPVLTHTINGISHNVTPSFWTTTIEFMRTFINE